MLHSDKRIDAYIKKSAPFAQPILIKLRANVHKYCPEVTETLKWNFPHFIYHDNILCSMASFKQHCAFTFWLAEQMQNKHEVLQVGKSRDAMGHLGKLTSVKDLPTDKIFGSYIKDAMSLIDSGVKLKKKSPKKASTAAQEDFLNTLAKNKRAFSAFEKFSPSQRKEYVGWIEDAKTDATRVKRIQTAVEWISEGKIRNWKYQ